MDLIRRISAIQWQQIINPSSSLVPDYITTIAAASPMQCVDCALQVRSEKYDQFDRPYYGRMIKKLGDPNRESERFAAMSPINFVDKIHVPVFVAGGTEDQTVEIQQSKRLVSALDKYHVPYEKLFIGEEADGMAHFKSKQPRGKPPRYLTRPPQTNPSPMHSTLNPVPPTKPKQASGYRTHSE